KDREAGTAPHLTRAELHVLPQIGQQVPPAHPALLLFVRRGAHGLRVRHVAKPSQRLRPRGARRHALSLQLARALLQMECQLLVQLAPDTASIAPYVSERIAQPAHAGCSTRNTASA